MKARLACESGHNVHIGKACRLFQRLVEEGALLAGCLQRGGGGGGGGCTASVQPSGGQRSTTEGRHCALFQRRHPDRGRHTAAGRAEGPNSQRLRPRHLQSCTVCSSGRVDRRRAAGATRLCQLCDIVHDDGIHARALLPVVNLQRTAPCTQLRPCCYWLQITNLNRLCCSQKIRSDMQTATCRSLLASPPAERPCQHVSIWCQGQFGYMPCSVAAS